MPNLLLVHQEYKFLETAVYFLQGTHIKLSSELC